MKTTLTAFVLLLVFVLNSNAQSDTLVINLKNGSTDKIAIGQISKIRFENITSVNEKTNYKNNTELSNHPNPFTDATIIEFELEETGNADINIFDNSGNLIQKLNCIDCQTGKNEVNWNGIDLNGNKVQSGSYICEIRFKGSIQTRKMIVIR